MEITEFLTSRGYAPLVVDPCILRNATSSNLFIIWVDDIIPIAKSLSDIAKMQAMLESKYELRDLGELQEYLGISIVRNRQERSLFLSRIDYAKEISKHFHLEDYMAMSSPSADLVVLLANKNFTSNEDCFLYLAPLGSLMYKDVWTRPYLSERCSKLG